MTSRGSAFEMNRRKLVEITGIVQGVGFRPFVYGLAHARSLSGWVCNDVRGVTLEVQGDEPALDGFLHALTHALPPLARIDRCTVTDRPALPGERGFVIRQSQPAGDACACISPDQGACPACLADVANPLDRHYRYPFTNCTHCGPRYTIIRRLPYDRPATAMADFAMCPRCAAAYHDPLDRRYHAQPVSCPECGPQLTLRGPDGRPLAEREAALAGAVAALRDGALVAVKGMGGFHLMCDAADAAAVARLRALKRRARKPLAVLCRDRRQAEPLVQASEAEWQLALSQARPITLMRRGKAALAPNLAPGVPYLGLFFPYTPLHQLLLDGCARPLVATSANLSGAPILTEGEAVLRELGHGLDLLLDHNRPILHPCDDSLVQIAGGRRQMLRLARGYAPWSPPLPQPLAAPVLAVGAQQKVSLALAFGRTRLYGPYLGDLGSLAMQREFETQLALYRDLYRFRPALLACDDHPGYDSSRWAQAQADAGLSLLRVQHHHAHLLAVMAEHGITGPVNGIAFDGTGLGADGTLWGGEWLRADVHGCTRLGHLKPFRLIGGEQAIREPARLLLGWLLESMTPEAIRALRLPVIERLGEVRFANLCQLWRLGRNAPYASSVGRLFDALAALLGLVETLDYEGEAGLLVEGAAMGAEPLPMAFALDEQGVFDATSLLPALLGPAPAGQKAAGFIAALADLVARLAEREPGLPLVLAGGVFQNRLLMEQVAARLPTPCLVSETLPLNDGGIAAGQLWYAIHHPDAARPGLTHE